MATETQNKPGPKQSEAFQRHHNHWTHRALTDETVLNDPFLKKQPELALTRRLDGEVKNHTVDTNGIKIVIDP